MSRAGRGLSAELKLFHLLMHIGRLLEDRCRERLAGFGLHHGQARVLMTLARHGPTQQATLARGMDIAPPTLSVMLGKLLEQKLVSRRAVPGDERAYEIGLTADGEAAVVQIRRVWTEAGRVILDASKDIDFDTLHDTLIQVRDGLGGRGPNM